MIAAAVLFLVGLTLTAFFSGVETGFFRVPRVRLQLDALAGDRLARALFWLSNRPGLFVATTLLGNNLADDVLSLALVIIADSLNWEGNVAEIVLPILLSPLVYAYGAALPKQLFLEAPYRLLRMGGPLIVLFTILLAPISLLLWGLSKALEWLAGESHQPVQLDAGAARAASRARGRARRGLVAASPAAARPRAVRRGQRAGGAFRAAAAAAHTRAAGDDQRRRLAVGASAAQRPSCPWKSRWAAASPSVTCEWPKSVWNRGKICGRCGR